MINQSAWCFDDNHGKLAVLKSAKEAYDWLKLGNVLAYPTESVWGLGCDAFNEKAVERLLCLKSRSKDKGLIVLTYSATAIEDFLRPLPKMRQQQILHSWQSSTQASTWLLELPENTNIPKWLTGSHKSLGVRPIEQPVVAQLCRLLAQDNAYGFLVSTSCNPNAQKPALNFNEAYGYFGTAVGYLMGETLGFDKPSQILDAKTGVQLRM